MGRLMAAACAATLGVLFLAAPASAAPTYESSEPAAGSTAHKPPERVSVTFSEPLDPSSELTVTDDCGRRIDDGEVEVLGMEMSVGSAIRSPGPMR